MSTKIDELNKLAMTVVWNSSDPDKDVDKMYIPRMYTTALTNLIIDDCKRALRTELRDMISRGHAADIIKGHFSL